MLAGFIRPVSHLLLKCGKGGFHLSKALLSGAQFFLHMLSDSGHRFMHVIQTGVIAGLFAAKMDFTFSVRAVNTVSGRSSNSSSTGVATEIRFSGLNLKRFRGLCFAVRQNSGIPCRGLPGHR